MTNTKQSMQLLQLADPAQQAYRVQRSKLPRRTKWLAGGLATVLLLVVSAGAQALIATEQPLTTAAQSPGDIHNAALGSDELNLDINDPAIRKVVDKYIGAYPIPPGEKKEEVFAPILQAFPVPRGEGLGQVAVKKHPRWSGYFTGVPYLPANESEPELSAAVAISEPSLSGMIALVAANAWYRYWLDADPATKARTQSTLNDIQNWPDLSYRLGCYDRTTCPGRITEIARIAQAAADGNPTPLRQWLNQF